jgi:hypothetical protein
MGSVGTEDEHGSSERDQLTHLACWMTRNATWIRLLESTPPTSPSVSRRGASMRRALSSSLRHDSDPIAIRACRAGIRGEQSSCNITLANRALRTLCPNRRIPSANYTRSGRRQMTPTGGRLAADDEGASPVTILDGRGRVIRIVAAEEFRRDPRTSRTADNGRSASKERARQDE